MSRASEMTRRQAHLFIFNHPLRDEFLDWMDEHEDVVDDLKLVVEEMAADGDPPIEDGTLIERLRADFEDVREEWAPLVVNLLLWEFPELRPHLKRGVWMDVPSDKSAKDERDTDSQDTEPDELRGEIA